MIAPLSPVWDLVHKGEELSLFTSQFFRENEQGLYGFLTAEERNFFELLTTVSGVGPKLASTILARIERTELVDKIVNEDIAGLVAVPGIGKRTAERIIIELRDRVFGTGKKESGQKTGTVESEQVARALETLGFSAKERKSMVDVGRKLLTEGMAVEDVLKKILSERES